MAKAPDNKEMNRVHVVSPGSTIRFETPQSNRKEKHNSPVFIVQEVNPVGGFVNFLREHAVVGLAIGFIIGLQAQILVKELVSSFINPAFQLLFGKALTDRKFTLQFNGRTADFTWGAFVYGLLDFLFVLATIYAIVKLLKLDKLEKPKKKQKDKEKESDEVTIVG